MSALVSGNSQRSLVTLGSWIWHGFRTAAFPPVLFCHSDDERSPAAWVGLPNAGRGE
jgi:hypothetical protein